MRAYYRTFTPTGCDAVDAILEAIALAGKAFHNTSEWYDGEYNGTGKSYWQLIQEAADNAAKCTASETGESYRVALVTIRDECFNGHAHDIAEAALNNALAAPSAEYRLSKPEGGESRSPEGITNGTSDKKGPRRSISVAAPKRWQVAYSDDEIQYVLEALEKPKACDQSVQNAAASIIRYLGALIGEHQHAEEKARAMCDWPSGNFRVMDDPDPHKPCYLICPDGAAVGFSHHDGEGVDKARVMFIADACNAALSATRLMADEDVMLGQLRAINTLRLGFIVMLAYAFGNGWFENSGNDRDRVAAFLEKSKLPADQTVGQAVAAAMEVADSGAKS
jgi:hypothetical protein